MSVKEMISRPAAKMTKSAAYELTGAAFGR